MVRSRDKTAGNSWRFESPRFSVLAADPPEVLSNHTCFKTNSMLVNNGLHKEGWRSYADCLLGGTAGYGGASRHDHR